MKQYAVAIALACCMTEATMASGPIQPGIRSEPELKRELLQLENEWVQAELKHDAASLNRILDDKFIATFGSKKPYDKQDFIKLIANGVVDPTESQTLNHEFVIINRDTAVIVETDTLRKTKNGKVYSAVFRFTCTYVYRGNHWRALAEQGVEVPQTEQSTKSP